MSEDEKKVEQKTAVWPKPPGPEKPAKDLPDEHPDKPKVGEIEYEESSAGDWETITDQRGKVLGKKDPKRVGERISALAWLCPCGLEMSYAERPVCTCGKSVRP